MAESIILKGASGLNNIVDPLRHQYNPETGVGFLAEAVNVDIDETGMIYRRAGQVQLSDISSHSLFCDTGDCFVIQDRTVDAALYKIGTDLSLTGIRSGLMKGAKVSYWQVGTKTYYSSAFQNGVIENGISSSWPTNDHVGADTTRSFYAAPLGNHICIFQGRMWIAVANVIWVSEPYAYGKFDMARCFFQFGSNVRMIKPVQSGVWVSTEESTGFIRGADKFSDMSFEKKTEVPAHEYSANIELVDLSATALQIQGLSAIWSSDDGLSIGTADGTLIVPTANKLLYPTGSSGATVVSDYNVINSVY